LEGEHNRFVRLLRFAWSLFIAFLNKLSPARRLMYGVALLLVVLAIFQHNRSTDIFYAFLIVNFLLALEMADRLTTRDELDVARDIQESLRPEITATERGFELAAYAEPARNVGGDYYDILRQKDGSLLIVVADVSGKGISAALYAAKVQTALQLFSEQTQDLVELLSKLDGHLHDRLKKNFFITISLLKVLPNGKAQFCRAGHPPAILYSAEKKTCANLQPKGIAVGLRSNDSPAFAQALEVEHFKLKAGDICLLYTDGVVEGINGAGNEFGEQRLDLLLKTFPAESASTLKDRIAAELQRFREGAELRDDTTFVVIKRI
jgi:serine phosphatase RsbU (regulator of sigma subunit)